MEADDILAHYRDRCRDGEVVAVADRGRTDRGEVDEVTFDADAERDFIKVTVKIPVRRQTDR
jgi:hypothetical protein